MTGGMAFVHDPDQSFERRVNGDTVTWQRIASPQWEKVARDLIEEHARETASLHALDILAHWDLEVAHFWQVVPKELAAKGLLPFPLEAAQQAQRA
jgi:glutamate synthase (NADPH/NADH) large chain